MARKTDDPRPIPFSAAMVRAIPGGSKTQTRRVVKPQPGGGIDGCFHRPDGLWIWLICGGNLRASNEAGGPGVGVGAPFRAKYKVGDVLYVREAWLALPQWDSLRPAKIPEGVGIWYEADSDLDDMGLGKPRHGMFMCKWMARHRIEITGVRIQRIQEISEEDAIAEGFTQDVCEAVFHKAAGQHEASSMYWKEDEVGGSVDLCEKCAQLSEDNGEATRSDGGCAESDGPAYCDACGNALVMSLSEYGIERELFLEGQPKQSEVAKYFATSGRDARIAHGIASGMGDLREKHKGRLAQIAFATYIDHLSAKRGYGWDTNHWVYAITFKLLKEKP